jgi:RsiW-degrading membrane proteinase PrsW (M82 family)
MMRAVALFVLLGGVSALKRPSTSDMLRMTLKSRTVSDVNLDMEVEDAEPSTTTVDEIAGARWTFAGLVIIASGMAFGSYKYMKGPGAISEQQEEAIYNHAAPAAVITMALIMFFSVVGGVVALNAKVGTGGLKTNFPGYEGQSVAYERIDNPGERAFFASIAILTQGIVGMLICLYLRKQQDIQMATSLIMKMACRGAVAGTLATMFVEFVRLPFHDYMLNEDLVVGRVFTVLLWVGFVAIMEEVLKLVAVALGLKRDQGDAEASIFENPQALAICGLAAGVGFAITENIPRMYALALQRPLAEVQFAPWGDQSESYLIDESTLRAGRVWTFVFWGLLNIQPWLTGLAAIKLSQITAKGPTAPLDFFSALKFVVVVHFLFDLLDRSAHPLVEFLGCCAIPYAMYTFKKQWESMSANGEGLLGDRA